MITPGLTPPWSQTPCSGEGFSRILSVARALGSDLPTLQPAGERGANLLSLPPLHTQYDTLDGFLDILLHTFSVDSGPQFKEPLSPLPLPSIVPSQLRRHKADDRSS